MLNFDSSLKYVKEQLHNVNALSVELLNIVDFKKGAFFTFLPSDANMETLYEFKIGIRPCVIETDDSGGTYSIIPSIDEEISEILLQEIETKNLNCIFDDVLREPTDKHHMELFHSHGLHYNNEVYYLVKKERVSKEDLIEGLNKSLAFWHSLCVLTKADCNSLNKKLTLEEIKNICLNATTIIVGAYDGEGFIFWQRNE